MTYGTPQQQRLIAAGAARRGEGRRSTTTPWSLGTEVQAAAKPRTTVLATCMAANTVANHFADPTNRWPEEAPL